MGDILNIFGSKLAGIVSALALSVATSLVIGAVQAPESAQAQPMHSQPAGGPLQFPDPGAISIFQLYPSYDGKIHTGSLLGVQYDSNLWDVNNATLTVQWYHSGQPNVIATGFTYRVNSNDAGKGIIARLGETRLGYSPLAQTTPAVSVVTLEPQFPFGDISIYGDAIYGHELDLNLGYWSGAMYPIHWAWYRNGVLIPDTDNSTIYVLGLDDIGKSITVNLESTPGGFVPEYRHSNSSGIVKNEQFQDPGAITLTSVYPMWDNRLHMGNQLQVQYDSTLWDTANASITVQWYRGRNLIPGATGFRYRVTGNDAGMGISARLTETRAGYDRVSKATAPISVVTLEPQFPYSGISVYGDAIYGHELDLDLGTWYMAYGGSMYGVHWAWYRNGALVPGTDNSAVYFLGLEDIGKRITVRLDSTPPGYVPEYRVSSATAKVAKATFAFTDTPTIQGTTEVGETLSAQFGNWDVVANFNFQWYRNNRPIAGATDIQYVLQPTDVGAKISVKATGYATGYQSVSKVSAQTAAVQR